MKLAFIYDETGQPGWNDGLREALRVLEAGWVVKLIHYKDVTRLNFLNPDVVLAWGSLQSPAVKAVCDPLYDHFKKGLVFGGGPTNVSTAHKFDIVFAESRVDLDELREMGVNTTQAFGTNTKLFRPIPEQPKVFDAFYPANFALWKHHEVFADYCKEKGVQGLAVGQFQDHEKECYLVCLQKGIMVMPAVPYEVMPWLYNSAKEVILCADYMGGSQRAVLEAKACGVPVTILSDSPKLLELAPLTREQVLADWSEDAYASKLDAGLRSIL